MAGFENSIHEVGNRAATYKHIELVITSALSTWIDVMPEASAVAMAGAHAHVHADHAQLWHDRIPMLWDHNESEWNAYSNDELTAITASLQNNAEIGDTHKKLEVMYRHVLPAILQTYSAHLVTIDPRVDPATAHILQTCINNTRDHIEYANDIIARMSSAS